MREVGEPDRPECDYLYMIMRDETSYEIERYEGRWIVTRYSGDSVSDRDILGQWLTPPGGIAWILGMIISEDFNVETDEGKPWERVR